MSSNKRLVGGQKGYKRNERTLSQWHELFCLFEESGGRTAFGSTERFLMTSRGAQKLGFDHTVDVRAFNRKYRLFCDGRLNDGGRIRQTPPRVGTDLTKKVVEYIQQHEQEFMEYPTFGQIKQKALRIARDCHEPNFRASQGWICKTLQHAKKMQKGPSHRTDEGKRRLGAQQPKSDPNNDVSHCIKPVVRLDWNHNNNNNNNNNSDHEDYNEQKKDFVLFGQAFCPIVVATDNKSATCSSMSDQNMVTSDMSTSTTTKSAAVHGNYSQQYAGLHKEWRHSTDLPMSQPDIPGSKQPTNNNQNEDDDFGSISSLSSTTSWVEDLTDVLSEVLGKRCSLSTTQWSTSIGTTGATTSSWS